MYEFVVFGDLFFFVINVNDLVIKSKFDNRYGIWYFFLDGFNWVIDVFIGGKVVFVCGYGDVGKGVVEVLWG